MLQANLRACNEELRSHVEDLKQEMEVQRMAISHAEHEKVLTFNTAFSRSGTKFYRLFKLQENLLCHMRLTVSKDNKLKQFAFGKDFNLHNLSFLFFFYVTS